MTNPKAKVDFGVIHKQALADKITDRILTLIRQKHLRPGDRLPPERKLAEMLAVSRPSLREALRAPAIMKIVENRQGAGTYITSLELEILVEHLESVFALDDVTYLNLLEARKVVEPALAEMAAREVTDDEIKSLEECLVRSGSGITDPEAFLEVDLLLHRIIGEAAHNTILSCFMSSVARLGVHSRRRTGEKLPARKQTIEDHRAIVRALRSHDPQAARQAMLDHLNHVQVRLTERDPVQTQTAE